MSEIQKGFLIAIIIIASVMIYLTITGFVAGTICKKNDKLKLEIIYPIFVFVPIVIAVILGCCGIFG